MAIVELLREQPGLGTSAVATATNAKVGTVTERLKRLRLRGAVEGSGVAGWRLAATG